MTLSWSSWAATDVGTVRTANEDTYVDQPARCLWAVADGAGGHEHGEVAAAALKAALEGAPDLAGVDRIVDARNRVVAVHKALCHQAAEEAAATGRAVIIASTLVVLLADGAHFACLWCGDSRAYLLRGGMLTQLTRDHSLVQELVDSGVLAAEEAERHPRANVLTRAIGAEGPPPELDKITGLAEPGDRFLLCSDGLFKVLDAEQIGQLVGEPDPARAIIAAALAAAARDNVTAVVVETALAPAPDAGDDGTLLVRG